MRGVPGNANAALRWNTPHPSRRHAPIHRPRPRPSDRDAELKARGFRVLRLWNDDVLRDMNAACDTIIAYVRDTNLRPWR
ncbi:MULTISPECIES: DUF559 domain-containing protein [unclassified Mesorhizobium]|uniref:DUF559 domain-containing protein n=1 Tax=unclassified Mesorhizobium TaxID=325217 RepID=UPI001CCBF21E|nr:MULTISPECIES: DUF559 domain-containing protein [unclassified Mesorhizobium]MBZ9737981.1 endonuclease domain-containing protein [Mesorhizobium sp. CO1-1-4]MBZ9801832.1 endonuclease domain-containing protein [Mesorhizobium sp. ES1-6]